MAYSLTIPELIIKKRNGEELSKENIDVFIDAVVSGKAESVQIGAMLMAIYQKDLSVSETNNLTQAMVNSGETLEWPPEWNGILVDKHSTGGVGDKISLILAPALAACGLKVPMISGRGLGHTGGTLDKLESIPGFQVSVDTDKMVDILRHVGCCIVGQTSNLCPADGILYKSRDITGTVDNIGLITASIVSKKAAENINALVLDVKAGKGAFCETVEKAKMLAVRMVEAGNGMGVKTSAVITDMNYPIGRMIGNALEVAEAIKCLQGQGPEDINELVERLGGQLLLSADKVKTSEEGSHLIRQTLDNGCALSKFKQMTIAQGVSKELAEKLCHNDIDIFEVLPKAKFRTHINCKDSGTVTSIDAMDCAVVAQYLGAGRTKFGEKLKEAVGLQLLVTVNSTIKEGDPWVIVHHDDPLTDIQIYKLENAITVQSVHNTRIIEIIT